MKIALIGYGKMGKEIEQIAIGRGHTVVLKIDVNNQQDLTSENLSLADVAIEFTTPATAISNYRSCFNAGVPVISGTTGWLDQKVALEYECLEKDGCFFYASNFSLGVNLFFELNKVLARMMKPFPEYDVTLTEIHHTQKLDAPSGTAITPGGRHSYREWIQKKLDHRNPKERRRTSNYTHPKRSIPWLTFHKIQFRGRLPRDYAQCIQPQRLCHGCSYGRRILFREKGNLLHV